MSLRTLTKTYRHGLFFFEFDNSYMVLSTKSILSDAYEKGGVVSVKFSKSEDPAEAKIVELSDDYSHLHNIQLDKAFEEDDREFFENNEKFGDDDAIKKILKIKQPSKKRKRKTSTVKLKVKKAKKVKKVKVNVKKNLAEMVYSGGVPSINRINIADDEVANNTDTPSFSLSENSFDEPMQPEKHDFSIQAQSSPKKCVLKELKQITPQIVETRLKLADLAENTPTNQPIINDERFRKLEQMIERNTKISERNTEILERILGKIDLMNKQKVYNSPAKPSSTVKKTTTTTTTTNYNPATRVELFPETEEAPTFTGRLSFSAVKALKTQSVSIPNFALKLAEKLFTEEERTTSNCAGTKGKRKFSAEKIDLIYEYVFEGFPVDERAREFYWKKCRDAINEAGRRKPKQKKIV